MILVDDLSIVESMVAEVEEQAVKLRQESMTEGILPADFPLPYVTWPDLLDTLQDRSFIELGHSTSLEAEEAEDSLSSCFSHDERFGGRLKPFVEYLTSVVERGEQAIIVSRQASRLEELWIEADHREAEFENLQFIEASVSEGFVLQSGTTSPTHLLTDSEVFGWERPQPRTRQTTGCRNARNLFTRICRSATTSFTSIMASGVLSGWSSGELDGHEREFLAVEYESGGQLYVPVHQADRLTRYVGAEGAVPALDRLGGQEWHEKKGRVKEAVLEGRAGDARPVRAA